MAGPTGDRHRALLPEEAPYYPVTADFEVVLDAANPNACIDVNSEPGDWTYTIVTEGRINSLWMAVKDSQPGDFCYQADLWRRYIPSEVTHYDVPAAGIDACDGKIAPADTPTTPIRWYSQP